MKKPFLFIGLLATTFVACSDPERANTFTPTPLGVNSVEVAGPATIAPGQSGQFIATLWLADGSHRTAVASDGVTWFSSNAPVLAVNSSGLATTTQLRGEARVTARVGSGNGTRSSSREVVVIPDGTYRLVGVIRDSEGPSSALGGARVEAVPGLAVTTSDSDGNYRLYGVPANGVIEVARAGYSTINVPVQLTGHATRNFNLVLTGRRATLDGDYTVIIDMAAGCTYGALEQELRRRTYSARVTQNGPVVDVVLTEPGFKVSGAGKGNRFSGFADNAGVTFTLDRYDWYYYGGPSDYPSVAERLPDGTVLVPQGKSIVVESPDGMSGGFNAFVGYYGAKFPVDRELSYCSSSAAQLTFVRR
jgi:hypothetical protein